jgi:hypothetical protein
MARWWRFVPVWYKPLFISFCLPAALFYAIMIHSKPEHA